MKIGFLSAFSTRFAAVIFLAVAVVVGSFGTGFDVKAAAPPITDFIVFGDIGLTLWKDVTIVGNVGCNCSFVIPVGTTIQGNVYSTGSVTNNGTVTGSITQNGDPVAMPPAAVITPGVTDIINLALNQTTTLAVGDYDVVRLGKKHTLNLSSGTYQMSSLTVGQDSTVNLDAAGGLNVYVAGDTSLGRNTHFVLSSGTPSDVYVESHGVLFFAAGGVGTWKGRVYVPFDVLHIGHETIDTGRFYARRVQIEADAFLSDEPPPPPVFENPVCEGLQPTIWVDANGDIHGGPNDGFPYYGFLIGTNGPDIIVGVDGTDAHVEVIDGKGGDDIICAGAGFDDIIKGGDGNDLIFGGPGRNEIDGQAGDDEIHGGDDIDIIKGGTGNDLIFAGDGNDYVLGNLGNDEIHGGGGNDNLNGQQDSDVMYGDDGNDIMNGGPGNDEMHGGDGNDTVNGQQDADTLFGDGDNDTLLGGPGNDALDGGTGTDKLDGQTHTDTCVNGEVNKSCP